MADSISSGDPDVDAAFASTDSGALLTGDSDVDAAFATPKPAPRVLGDSERVNNPVSRAVFKVLDYPQTILDRGADILASGSLPGEVTNPEAKNPANWTQREPPSPLAATALHVLPLLLGSKSILTKPSAIARDSQAVVNNSMAEQSMGAASAPLDISDASPQLKAAISAHEKINPDVLRRHYEADKFGIPLTEGQATRDSAIFSAEKNARKDAPAIAQRYEAQNKGLVDSLDDIRREASPTAVQNNAIEHGQTLVDKYKAYDAPIRADVSAKYKALADANGGDLPVDGNSFVNSADAALKTANKARYLPPEVRGTLDDLREGGNFTFNNFENLRTDLAAAVRKADRAGDGNAKAAINITRDALEQLPMTGEAATKLKPLADAARTAARTRFEAIEADPAYEAAVNDDVPMGRASPLADKFMDKYVIGSPRANLATLQEKFAGDPDVQEAIKGHTLNLLKGKAGINPDSNAGEFSQKGYNTALSKLGPKLDLLLGDSAERARSLGNVARHVQEYPTAHTVNTSNTASTIAPVLRGMAEHAVNANTHGLGMPIIRSVFPDRTAEKLAEKALKPGAGLDYVPPTPP